MDSLINLFYTVSIHPMNLYCFACSQRRQIRIIFEISQNPDKLVRFLDIVECPVLQLMLKREQHRSIENLIFGNSNSLNFTFKYYEINDDGLANFQVDLGTLSRRNGDPWVNSYTLTINRDDMDLKMSQNFYVYITFRNPLYGVKNGALKKKSSVRIRVVPMLVREGQTYLLSSPHDIEFLNPDSN